MLRAAVNAGHTRSIDRLLQDASLQSVPLLLTELRHAVFSDLRKAGCRLLEALRCLSVGITEGEVEAAVRGLVVQPWSAHVWDVEAAAGPGAARHKKRGVSLEYYLLLRGWAEDESKTPMAFTGVAPSLREYGARFDEAKSALESGGRRAMLEMVFPY